MINILYDPLSFTIQGKSFFRELTAKNPDRDAAFLQVGGVMNSLETTAHRSVKSFDHQENHTTTSEAVNRQMHSFSDVLTNVIMESSNIQGHDTMETVKFILSLASLSGLPSIENFTGNLKSV